MRGQVVLVVFSICQRPFAWMRMRLPMNRRRQGYDAMVNLMPVRFNRANDNYFKTIKADAKKGNVQLEICEISGS